MENAKDRSERDRILGMGAAKPEWQQIRDDLKKKTDEKTKQLRAARLAAEAARPLETAKPRQRTGARVRRAAASRA